MPGNKIDVFLQPLIKDLNELWTEGVETYDSSLKEVFRIRATLMWTTSDFPGLYEIPFYFLIPYVSKFLCLIWHLILSSYVVC